jgi:hypothetical protein
VIRVFLFLPRVVFVTCCALVVVTAAPLLFWFRDEDM